MLLIIEGSNRVGKTTLIRAIKKRRPDAIVLSCRTHNLFKKNSDIKKSNYAIAVAVYNMARSILEANPDALVILDRFHLSEMVYGEFDRKYNCTKEMSEIDDKLSRLNSKLIYLNSDYAHLSESTADEELRFRQLQLIFSVVYQYSKMQKGALCLDGKINEFYEVDSDTVDYCLQ